MAEKVKNWVKDIEMLSNISRTQPHAAYSAFIHGLRHHYTYIMKTVPEISAALKPLDKAIDNFFTVLFQGYLFNEDERALLSLPARLGGMVLTIPSETCRQITNHCSYHRKSKKMVKISFVATIKKPPK